MEVRSARARALLFSADPGSAYFLFTTLFTTSRLGPNITSPESVREACGSSRRAADRPTSTLQRQVAGFFKARVLICLCAGLGHHFAFLGGTEIDRGVKME